MKKPERNQKETRKKPERNQKETRKKPLIKENLSKLLQNPVETFKIFATPVRVWAFFSAVIIGFATHLFVFVNSFLNHDWVLNIVKEDFEWNIGQGRWLSNFFRSLLSTDYSMGWVIGLNSIFFLALTSVILTELFNVKQKSSAVLMSGLLLIFPVVASSFSYMPFSDGYFLCAVLAAVAVLITEKCRFGWLYATPFVVIILGIYQPYWSFMVMVSFLCILLAVFNEGESESKLQLMSLRHFLLATLGLGVYGIGTMLSLNITKLPMVVNQGGNQFGPQRFSIDVIGKFVSKSYSEFWFSITEALSGGSVVTLRQILMYCMLSLLAGAIIYLIVKKKVYKSITKTVITCWLIVLTPVVSCFALLISDGTWYHMIMRYSYVVLFLAVVVMFEKIEDLTIKKVLKLHRQLFKFVPGLVCSLLIFSYFVLSNLGYYNMQLRYEKDYSFTTRLIERIESHEGYKPGMPVAVEMMFPRISAPDDSLHRQLRYMIGMDTDSMLYFNDFFEFSKWVLGVDMKDGRNYMGKIKETEEYKKMGYWPEKSSVDVIDGVAVAKIR